MTDVLDGVRDHYRASGLTGRLKTALMGLGPEDHQLTPQQLSVLDEFHVRGLAATAELAKLVGIPADRSVGANAANKLPLDRCCNSRSDRTSRFPHTGMARRH